MSDEPQRIGPEESADTLRSVAEARVAVADSRARISATIDELEDRIVGHKEALQEKLDVARPVRAFVGASPLLAIVAAAGAGLLLGLATGGRTHERRTPLSPVDDETIRRWRREGHKRLLDTAGEELPRFESPPSRFGRLVRDLVHEFAGAGTALLAAKLADRVKGEPDER